MEDLIEELADGTPCRIGLCRLDGDCYDRESIKSEIGSALRRMSPRSRRLRFATPLSRLSDAQLDYLTDFDQRNRIAWCAFDATGSKDNGIGLARYIRLGDAADTAEFAVTIVDQYQRRGLGTVLLGRLIDSARENGIHVLRGYALPSNEGMLRLGARFHARLRREDSFLRMDVLVDGDDDEEEDLGEQS
jgi:RimJ/RimL family protein N-acetyltransferase